MLRKFKRIQAIEPKIKMTVKVMTSVSLALCKTPAYYVRSRTCD